jgi:hypothetical protein
MAEEAAPAASLLTKTKTSDPCFWRVFDIRCSHMDLPLNQQSDPQNEDHQEQQFDNSRVVLDKVSRCLTEGLMSDVVLVVGNSSFPSHRMILCASSDVFRVMLSNYNFTESHQQRIQLQEDPHCVMFFPQFLHYLYQVLFELCVCVTVARGDRSIQ